MSTVPPWLRTLVDDAAVFPPGNASLPDAVRAHREHRASPIADLVGPLVLPAAGVEWSRLASLARPAGGELAVALVGTAEDLEAAGQEVAATPVLTLAAVAARLPDATDATSEGVDAAVARLRTTVGDGTPIALELPLAGADLGPAWIGAVEAAATHGVRVKLRTGGLAPDAFPTPHELATAITTVVRQGAAFQCTAGLHHAVRAEDPGTGQVHHGFLNVLIATRASLDGADMRTVSTILEELSGDVLAKDVDALGAEALSEARRWFTSFGSCSISDPVDDLRSLGLM